MLIFLTTNPEFLLDKMAPLIYSIMGILGFIVIGKGIYNGDSLKEVAGKIIMIGVVSYMAYTPVVIRNIGATIVNFITSFTELQ